MWRAISMACFSVLAMACTPATEREVEVEVDREVDREVEVEVDREVEVVREVAPPPSHDGHIRFEAAPPGDLAPIVVAHIARARAEGRVPLVYVGATWCEPCRYFHEAAERGDLDGELPALSLLELDLDRDGDRVTAAGYGSRMIPLFAVPGDDGRGTDRRIEGSIHGPGSPAQIVPRLLGILRGEP